MKGSPIVALVLGTLALLLVVAGPEWAAASAPMSAHITLAVLSLVFVAAAVGLAARDRIVFAYLITVLGLFGVVGVLLVRSLAAPWTTQLLLTLGASTLGILLGTGYALGYWLGRDTVPDILRMYAHASVVYELRGVEFAWFAEETLRSDAIVPVKVLLQNCSDTTREVRLKVRDVHNYPWSKDSLVWRLPEPVTLGPSALKVVTFPLCALPGAGGEHALDITLQVTGTRGHRSRRQRAPSPPRPISLFLDLVITVLQAPLNINLGGYVLGGLQLTIVNCGRYRSASELPLATVKSVWSPGEPASSLEQLPRL